MLWRQCAWFWSYAPWCKSGVIPLRAMQLHQCKTGVDENRINSFPIYLKSAAVIKFDFRKHDDIERLQLIFSFSCLRKQYHDSAVKSNGVTHKVIGAWNRFFFFLLSNSSSTEREALSLLVSFLSPLWMNEGLWDDDVPGQLQSAGVNRAKIKIC